MNIRNALDGDFGYSTLGFRPDLESVRSLIREQWIARIKQLAPQYVEQFETAGIDRYHEHASLIDHASAWPKRHRMLGQEAIRQFRALSIVKTLEGEFGPFAISDEESSGRENIYWRLVRPNSASDVGPIHADEWFWALGHGTTPPDVRRVKVWMAVYCEPGQSGFRFVPGSHRKDWPYIGERRHGMVKPLLQTPERDLDLKPFYSEPGDAIVFNDRLLHGGMVGGSKTRVSLEFTLFTPS